MAKKKRKKKGTSLKRIIIEIHKVHAKVTARKTHVSEAQAKKLDLKLKRLDTLESRAIDICRGSGLYI
jgi:hypothetical protein